MTFHMMKTGFVILLALVFSASQLCACMAPMDDAPAGHHKHQSSAMVMGDHDVHHEAQSGNDGDHDMHGGETGCGHCAAPSLEASVVVAKVSATLSHAEPEKFVTHLLAIADDVFESLLPPVVRGHAWLDPPPTTPITLKTRLLH